MTSQNQRVIPYPLVWAIALGAISTLGYAPMQWWGIQFVSLTILFRLHSYNQAKAFLLGWGYGFGSILAGVYWLFIAMHRFGDMPAILASLAVLLFALFIGIYPGLALWAATKLRRKASETVYFLCIVPACWALSEWLRGWIMTGFPWLVSGYAHTNSPLNGFAPILGVYGVGLVAALAASLLFLGQKKGNPNSNKMYLAIIALFVLGFGLRNIHWTQPSGSLISVRLLQGNISQDAKFARERVIDSLQLYQRLITQQRADLIVTPETAFPIFTQFLPPEFLPGLQDFATRENSNLILGVPIADPQEKYANSALGISSQASATPYRYDKHHLVPFGEFIPPGFRWFVNLMQIPLGDFTPGATIQQPFAVKDQWISPNICYEDLFGEEIAAQLGENAAAGKPVATLLLNISNLAWYGDSSAIPQHLQISKMRALETGRTMLRATNTGATALISPEGKVLSLLATDKPGVLSANVQGYSGLTPYVRWRNWPFLCLSLGMLLLAYILAKRNPA